MFILTKLNKEEIEKILGDIIYLSIFDIIKQFDVETADLDLKHRDILINQRIGKKIRSSLTSSKKMKISLPVVYQITEFDERIIGNIKNLIHNEKSNIPFKTTEQEYIDMTIEMQELFDDFV